MSTDSVPVIEAVLVSRIGTRGSPEEAYFGEVTDVTISRQGVLYAADGLNQRISVYNVSGAFIFAFGREGSGPGEFKYPISLGLREDTSLVVFDPHLWRATIFKPDGTVSGTFAPDPTPLFGQVHEVRWSRTGDLINLSYAGYQEGLLDDLGLRRKGLARGSVTVEQWDTFAGSWTRLVDLKGIQVFVDLDVGTIQDVGFAEKPLWAVSPRGAVWYADNSEYRVFHRDAVGETSCLLVTGVTPQPVGAADRIYYYDARDQPNDRAERARERRVGVPLPDRKPVISKLVAEGDSLVWVRTSTEREGFIEWHVVRLDGSMEHRIRLPARFEVTRVRDGKIVGIVKDSLDVARIEVYELGPDR